MSESIDEAYRALLLRAWEKGDRRADRTGIGTRALFGPTLTFDLADDAIPLLTLKRVSWKTATRELLWFLSGDTNIRPLVAQGVRIWTAWPLARYRRETSEAIDQATFEARIVDDATFAARWGDLGPVYGAQWVRWPTVERDADGTLRDGPPVNQLADLVAAIRADPTSRRLLFTGWNVADLPRMALPPCHMTYQFFVGDGRLSCLLFQRSCDIGLGLPFNLFEAALLTRMIAQQTDLAPGWLHWQGGDTHVYENQQHLVAAVRKRSAGTPARLMITRRPADLFSYLVEDFVVEDYAPQPAIAAEIAV